METADATSVDGLVALARVYTPLLLHTAFVLVAVLGGIRIGRMVAKALQGQGFNSLFDSPFKEGGQTTEAASGKGFNPSVIAGWGVMYGVPAVALWVVARWRAMAGVEAALFAVIKVGVVAAGVIAAGTIVGRLLAGSIARIFIRPGRSSGGTDASSSTLHAIGIAAGIGVYITVYLVLLTLAAELLGWSRIGTVLPGLCGFATRVVYAVAILVVGRLGAGWLCEAGPDPDADPVAARWRVSILGLTVLWGMVAISGAEWGTVVMVVVFLAFAVVLSIGHDYIGDVTAGFYLKRYNVHSAEIGGKPVTLVKRGLLLSEWKHGQTVHRFGNKAVLLSILGRTPESALQSRDGSPEPEPEPE